MAFDGAGNYTKPVTAVTPAVAATTIDSSAMNTWTTDVETAFNICLGRDGVNHVVTADLPMSTFKHTGVGDAAALTDYASANQVVDNALTYGADAGGDDTYAVSLTISPGAYVAGNRVQVLATTANTGACTLNVNGLGAKNIKLADGNDPHDGAIQATSIFDVQYDGTNFILLNPWDSALSGVTASATELNYLDGSTPGSATANNALVVDGSLDIDTLNIVTAASFVGPVTGAVTGNVTGDVTGDLTGTVTATSVLADGVTATTQSADDSSTAVATTAYVDTATDPVYTTPVATTSGSGVEVFTSIPAAVTRVIVVFKEVSTTAGGVALTIQIGSAGGYKSTGYSGSGTTLSANSMATATFTNGFTVYRGAANTGNVSGLMTLEKQTGNIWVASGSFGTETTVAHVTGGSADLAATLTKIQLTTSGTLNNGTISLIYK